MGKKIALTVQELAALLSIDRRTVAQAIDDGQIESVYIGSRCFIPIEWVKRTFYITDDMIDSLFG